MGVWESGIIEDIIDAKYLPNLSLKDYSKNRVVEETQKNKEYKKNVDMVNQFIIDFKKEFFLPKDSNCK